MDAYTFNNHDRPILDVTEIKVNTCTDRAICYAFVKS